MLCLYTIDISLSVAIVEFKQRRMKQKLYYRRKQKKCGWSIYMHMHHGGIRKLGKKSKTNNESEIK